MGVPHSLASHLATLGYIREASLVISSLVTCLNTLTEEP